MTPYHPVSWLIEPRRQAAGAVATGRGRRSRRVGVVPIGAARVTLGATDPADRLGPGRMSEVGPGGSPAPEPGSVLLLRNRGQTDAVAVVAIAGPLPVPIEPPMP